MWKRNIFPPPSTKALGNASGAVFAVGRSSVLHNLPGEVSQEERLSKTKISSKQLENTTLSSISPRHWEFCRAMLQIYAIPCITDLWFTEKGWVGEAAYNGDIWFLILPLVSSVGWHRKDGVSLALYICCVQGWVSMHLLGLPLATHISSIQGGKGRGSWYSLIVHHRQQLLSLTSHIQARRGVPHPKRLTVLIPYEREKQRKFPNVTHRSSKPRTGPRSPVLQSKPLSPSPACLLSPTGSTW